MYFCQHNRPQGEVVAAVQMGLGPRVCYWLKGDYYYQPVTNCVLLAGCHVVVMLVVLFECVGLKLTDALVIYLARHHVEYVKEILQECDTSSVNGLYLTFATTQVRQEGDLWLHQTHKHCMQATFLSYMSSSPCSTRICAQDTYTAQPCVQHCLVESATLSAPWSFCKLSNWWHCLCVPAGP